MRILLVEDDPMMGKAVKIALQQASHVVDLVDSAEDAELALDTTDYEIMVLDINLPQKSGLELIKDVRLRKKDIPVLALTARDATKHKVEGFNAGFDDYLVKPFDLDELLVRIQALYRRRRGGYESNIICGDIQLDKAAKIVRKNGQVVELSGKEYAILAILLENAGKVLNKQEIEDKLYGWDTEIGSNAVEVHISHLRRKLGDNVIKTIRGLGYIADKIS